MFRSTGKLILIDSYRDRSNMFHVTTQSSFYFYPQRWGISFSWRYESDLNQHVVFKAGIVMNTYFVIS
ncbi:MULTISPECIES: hypothetical protein [Acinetobacter]|uniref:hypothetical protein n=1 Tax=Acinetobacter TaxID=469 RepID=UPI00141B6284|nr:MULTISPECIES: hypothetical protein [Acinetobacter]MCS4297508.1 hypothetical protein [Acinetobacter guillouiae]MCW2249811.1 hypothetical protein [Acinetobacter sp. BIGb0204]NII38915.1 hypothetical protein [Acinetobacter sp. BIGb0196]